ncbi:MAG: 16S rRNA (guanine(527)-N(7))-methyltransferase RsmG [Bacteroidetes bacterium]|nr:16S rRNA (guanine(527)-N(7))-methyltransferase RsmG [Rhodothermia bacterium]MCS7155833.1 16S rRNA (guanine(527)-N(7))-methyltransferase RsmG [Bacteroidota bacterium]MCX7906066.1 16S rRNA (guanine(527)-N(7))-methyltransferase RsmG [Bacteroidota bacterium]MDW8138194.1 16S rRNA (guanine(527)-N(7))-methyltransferase RsmG [Bacteroidota bacterium]MDW8285878.1 16S rRNA (guanine(527)-N(7))-methyltransferase RsmG [Bacteroidota bacterium]
MEHPWLRALELDSRRWAQLRRYAELLRTWSQRLNLVSRRDLDRIWERHVLHSLSIARRRFGPGDWVLDVGTGGGLPGIPLAIAFPEARFLLLDATAKKVAAVRAMVRELGLEHVEVRHGRAEGLRERFTHVVSRAVGPLDVLWSWVGPLLLPASGVELPERWASGLIALKGPDWAEEAARLRGVRVEAEPIEAFWPDPLMAGKFLVHVRPESEAGPLLA